MVKNVSKAVHLLLLNYCFMYLPLFMKGFVLSLVFVCIFVSFLSFTLKRKRELFALLSLSFGCFVAVNIM